MALASSLSSLSNKTSQNVNVNVNTSDRSLNYQQTPGQTLQSDQLDQANNMSSHHFHQRSTLERSPSDVTASKSYQQQQQDKDKTGAVKLRKQESMKHQRVNTLDALGPNDLGQNLIVKYEDDIYSMPGSETIRRYQNVIRKYETLKENHEKLQRNYLDLTETHNSIEAKLKILQEERFKLKKSFDEAQQERNFALKERNGLQQQCTAAIRQWDKALRENIELKEQLAKVQQQRDEAMKEINHAMAIRIKATKDMARLTEERNDAVQENNLIMSERDAVHKEIEKLQEELVAIQKRNKVLEAENKVCQEEIQGLKREIASALTDRDRVLKVCNDLREKHSDYQTGMNDETISTTSPTSPFRSIHSFFGSSSSGVSSSWAQIISKGLTGDLAKPSYLSAASSSSSVSTLSHQTNKLPASNTSHEVVNVEVESMKKQLERLQIDLIDAQQEVEVCKKRRDWAFNERDKIVLERESIRKLCDKLRRERDRAVSDLAEALRDSDDIKKQRNDALKELNEIKENQDSKFKAGQIVGLNNTSIDSAIDTDMQEFDLEMINVCLKRNKNKINDDWGFDLGTNQNGIFVSSIVKDSAADGKIKLNDYILKINETNLINDVKFVQNILNSVDINEEINMLIQRKKLTRGVQNVNIKIDDEQQHGLVLENGFYISKIINGSAAAKKINLAVGDRVLAINGKLLDNCLIDEVNQMLNSSNNISLQLKNLCSHSPGTSSNSSNSPVHEVNDVKTNFRERQKKMVSCSSQTEYTQQHYQSFNSSEKIRNSDKRNSEKRNSGIFSNKQNTQSGFSNLSALQKQISQPVHSPNLLDKAYNKIQNVFGERRNSKQKQQQIKEQQQQNVSNDEEGKTIAELDKVLDTYSKGKSNQNGKLNTKSFKLIKLIKKSGGTWPKYQSNQKTEILQDYGDVNAVTTLHPIKRKVRKSLNVFNIGNKSDKNNDSKILADSKVETPSHEVDQVHGFNQNESFNSDSKTNNSSIDSSKNTFPIYHSYIKNDKTHHKQTKSLIDPKIDYSVVSAQKDKYIIEYYKNRKGQKQGQHQQSRPHSIHDVLSDQIQTKSQVQSDHNPIYDSINYHSFQSSTSSVGVPTTSLNSGSYYYAVSNVSKNQFPSDSIPQPPVRYSSSNPHHTMLSQFVSRSGDSLAKNKIMDPRESVQNHSRTLSSYQPNIISSSNNYSPSYYTRFNNISPTINDVPHGFLNNYLNSSHHLHHQSLHSTHKNSNVFINQDDPVHSSATTIDGLATIPKRNQRIRIPSNQSVTSKSSKLSTSSIDKYSSAFLSERGSPLPYAHIEWLSSSNDRSNSTDRKAKPMDIRSIYIEKNFEPLGIQISCDIKGNGGVFVSCVTPKSIAAQAGLMVGDQLLEVCGINMRTATYKLAANVLRQCGNSIRMLVQFNPDKYKTLQDADDGADDDQLDEDDTEDESNPQKRESWPKSL